MEAELEEPPAATPSEQRGLLEKAADVQVNDLSVSQMLKRLGWSRKRSVGAGGCDEFLRAAWRALIAGELDAGQLMFLDEMGPTSHCLPSTRGPAGGVGPSATRQRTRA